MRIPRFMLKDVVLAVGLISLGWLGFCAALWFHAIPAWARPVATLLVWSSPVWLCVGLAAPFRRKAWGGAVGCLIAVAIAGTLVVSGYLTHRNAIVETAESISLRSSDAPSSL